MADIHTVIGEQSTIRGVIRGDEDVVVFGYVEGRIELSSTLFVEQVGIVKADVTARHIVVSGIVVGDVTAIDCIEVAPEGRIVGNLSAPRLVMAAGAAVRGRVTMPAFEQPAEPARPEPERQPVVTRAPVHQPVVTQAPTTRAAAPLPPSRPMREPVERETLPMMEAAPSRPVAPEPEAARPSRRAPTTTERAPAPPPRQERPAPPPERPFRDAALAASAKSRADDLDSLFPAIPESPMDAWAVSTSTSEPKSEPNEPTSRPKPPRRGR